MARSTIVNHFAKDASFQTFMCDIVPKYIKVWSTQPGGGKLNLSTVNPSYQARARRDTPIQSNLSLIIRLLHQEANLC